MKLQAWKLISKCMYSFFSELVHKRTTLGTHGTSTQSSALRRKLMLTWRKFYTEFCVTQRIVWKEVEFKKQLLHAYLWYHHAVLSRSQTRPQDHNSYPLPNWWAGSVCPLALMTSTSAVSRPSSILPAGRATLPPCTPVRLVGRHRSPAQQPDGPSTSEFRSQPGGRAAKCCHPRSHSRTSSHPRPRVLRHSTRSWGRPRGKIKKSVDRGTCWSSHRRILLMLWCENESFSWLKQKSDI